jgi:hypothetical protein
MPDAADDSSYELPSPEPIRKRSRSVRLVLEKMDELGAEMRSLRDGVHKGLATIAAANARLDSVVDDVSRLNTLVRDGNGSPGLLTQVSQLQTIQAAQTNSIQTSVAGLTELTRRLDSLERTGSIPLQRFLEEQTLRRREASSQKWGMVVAIVSGIFALLAATITGVIQIMSVNPPSAAQALPTQEWRQYPPPSKATPSSPVATGK